MFSLFNIIVFLITVIVIGVAVYFVKSRFDNSKDFFSFLGNSGYCDYCGSKLMNDPIGSTPWNSVRQACPKCGYDCKKPNDAA